MMRTFFTKLFHVNLCILISFGSITPMTSASLCPATVAGLNRGLVSRAGRISLIGIVEKEIPGNVYLDFVLNDCTGRVAVRFFFPGGKFWLLPEFAGRYVKVVGRVSTTEVPYIITEHVALVDDSNEIAFHAIDVAHAFSTSRPRASGGV